MIIMNTALTNCANGTIMATGDFSVISWLASKTGRKYRELSSRPGVYRTYIPKNWKSIDNTFTKCANGVIQVTSNSKALIDCITAQTGRNSRALVTRRGVYRTYIPKDWD